MQVKDQTQNFLMHHKFLYYIFNLCVNVVICAAVVLPSFLFNLQSLLRRIIISIQNKGLQLMHRPVQEAITYINLL